MRNILYGEWLKLKRSKVVAIGFLGALIVPIFVLFASVQRHLKNPGSSITLFELYDGAIMFLLLLFVPLIMSIFAVFLIGREYSEKTLKTIFAVPVSRKAFLAGKFLMLFMIVQLFMLISWFHILILAVICKLFVKVSLSMTIQTFFFLMQMLLKMLFGGALSYLTVTPVLYLGIRNKAFITPLIASSAVCLLNVVLSGSGIAPLFPWTAVYVTVSGHSGNSLCPPYISFLIIALAGTLSAAASMKRFLGEDIT